jgi:hypothetical protein
MGIPRGEGLRHPDREWTPCGWLTVARPIPWRADWRMTDFDSVLEAEHDPATRQVVTHAERSAAMNFPGPTWGAKTPGQHDR